MRQDLVELARDELIAFLEEHKREPFKTLLPFENKVNSTLIWLNMALGD
jgi:hypothetical protein